MSKPKQLFPSFIKDFPGIELSGLITMASRPGMGNSSFSLYLIHDGLLQNLKVCFITYQQSKNFLEKRLSMSIALDKLTILDDFPYLKHSEVQLSHLFNRPFDLIILDDLGTSLGHFNLDEERMNQLILTLNTLSNVHNIPVIMNVTLGLGLEKRGGDKKPMFRDINWCRNLSVCSKQIYSIYRAGYYGFSEDENGIDVQNLIELICLKNEFGGTGRWVLENDLFKLKEMFC